MATTIRIEKIDEVTIELNAVEIPHTDTNMVVEYFVDFFNGDDNYFTKIFKSEEQANEYIDKVIA